MQIQCQRNANVGYNNARNEITHQTHTHTQARSEIYQLLKSVFRHIRYECVLPTRNEAVKPLDIFATTSQRVKLSRENSNFNLLKVW